MYTNPLPRLDELYHADPSLWTTAAKTFIQTSLANPETVNNLPFYSPFVSDLTESPFLVKGRVFVTSSSSQIVTPVYFEKEGIKYPLKLRISAPCSDEVSFSSSFESKVSVLAKSTASFETDWFKIRQEELRQSKRLSCNTDVPCKRGALSQDFSNQSDCSTLPIDTVELIFSDLIVDLDFSPLLGTFVDFIGIFDLNEPFKISILNFSTNLPHPLVPLSQFSLSLPQLTTDLTLPLVLAACSVNSKICKFTVEFSNIDDNILFQLVKYFKSFVPFFHQIKVNTGVLNSPDFFPKLNPESDTVSSSVLTCPSYSVLLIENEGIELKNLDSVGKGNLEKLFYLISEGILVVDYPFGSAKVPVKFSTVIASREGQNPLGSIKFDCKRVLPSVSLDFELMKVLFVLGFSSFDKNVEIPNEMIKVIEDDFVTLRQRFRENFNQDLLNIGISLSILIAKLMSSESLTRECWSLAVELVVSTLS
ncbi:hypothetical protein RCL1_000736 [Eukaryota sp. TZLM3-RCL]